MATDHAAQHQHEDLTDEHHAGAHHHITSPMVYIVVFALLMVLLIATVWAAYIHMGWMALPVAMLIASVKALLIILYFMHVKFSTRLTWIFAGASFIWLIMLLGITMGDYLSRRELMRSDVMTLPPPPAQSAAPAAHK